MDWSPSSPVASEDTFQDSNGAQPSFDYLYVQQQQQQQQQIQQHYMYTQQQQQQLGRFEWLDPSLTDHIAELCMIKLQQASNGRNHSLLRQVQLNSMLHRLRMLAFFRSPLPIYPHQPFHQQQQPQIAQPYDSSDLAANFGTAAVSPEVAATSDQLVMADPSSIASMGLPVSPPPLDPIRGYDWDQEALADHQLASNLSLNVLLNLDAQQQQPHHHQHLHLQESHPSQPQQQQHLQQPHPQQQSSHIQPLSAPSSASTPGLGQPELLSPTSPLSHLDHQQDKLPSPPLSSQDSASSALQPGMFAFPPSPSFVPAYPSVPVTCSSSSSLLPLATCKDRLAAGLNGAACGPFSIPTAATILHRPSCPPRSVLDELPMVSSSSSSSSSLDAITQLLSPPANPITAASTQPPSSPLSGSALTLPSSLLFPSFSSTALPLLSTLPATYSPAASSSPSTSVAIMPCSLHVPSMRCSTTIAPSSCTMDSTSPSGTLASPISATSSFPSLDNVSLAPCTEVAPSSDSGQSSIFPMGTNYQTNVTSQHQHQLQSANSTATPSSSTTPETVPLTTKDIMDVLSGHFPLQALRTVPNGNAGHSYQLEWQSESQPQAHLQPQLQLASTLVVDAASSPVATNVDSNNNYSDDDNNNTSTISQEPATTEFDLAGSAQPDDHAPGMNKAVVVVAQEACSESATAVVLSVQAGDHDPSIQPTVAVTASKLEHEESANVTTTSPSESSGMQADVEISDHKNSSGGSNNNHDMSMDMDIDTDMELAEASREIRLTSPPPSPSKRKRTVSGKSLWPQTEKRVTRSQLRGSTTTAVSEVMETLHVISDARGSPSSPNPRAKGSMNHTTLPSASARVMKRRRSNRGGSRQQQEEEASGSSSGASSSASSPESSPPSPKTPPPMQDHPFMAAMVDDKDPSSFRCSSDEKITEDPTSTATATTTTTTTSIAEKHPAMTMNLSDNEGNNDSDERSEASSASSRYPSRRGGVGLSTSGVSCGMSLTSAQQQQQASPPQQTASQQHRRQHGRSRSLTSTGLRDAMMVAHSLGPDGPLMAGSPGTSKVSAA